MVGMAAPGQDRLAGCHPDPVKFLLYLKEHIANMTNGIKRRKIYEGSSPPHRPAISLGSASTPKTKTPAATHHRTR
ncbi:MAG: hypothetical protein PGN34_15310 [Methylobacterium frigidaeris]